MQGDKKTASMVIVIRGLSCREFKEDRLFDKDLVEELKQDRERILQDLQKKVAAVEALVKAVHEKDSNFIPPATFQTLSSLGTSITTLENKWNHLLTIQGKRFEHVDEYSAATSRKFLDLMNSAQNHMDRRGCVIPFPGDGRHLLESGPGSAQPSLFINSEEFVRDMFLLEHYFPPHEQQMIPTLVKERFRVWKSQSITQIKSHLRTSKATKEVLKAKLYDLICAIPDCLINILAADGLVKFKNKLASTKEDLAAEREELAERQAREQRSLRRKMEDEKRRIEDEEDDIPVPPEHDFIPPKKSMFKKAKRDVQGDVVMNRDLRMPHDDDNDEDDGGIVPPKEDVVPPLFSLMRSMRNRAEKREEKKHEMPINITTQSAPPRAHLPSMSSEEFASQLDKIFSDAADKELADLAQKNLGVNNSRPEEL